MDGLDQDQSLLRDLIAHSGDTAAEVSRRANLAATTVQRPLKGTATTRLSQRTLEKLQSAYPDFPGWNSLREPRTEYRQQPRAEAFAPLSGEEGRDDSLAIPMLELAYGMGGTFLDDIDTGETLERFPRAFVRMFTNAPAELLCFSHGIGDSMEPTIGDRDLLLIDRSRDAIRINDQIWVIASGGIGMVKRVRVESNGQIMLLSDNANVPSQLAGEDELTVIGRVIAIVKRI